jgi:outer membrane protein TolC
VEAAVLAAERYRIAQIKRDMGLITRVELMEERIECTKYEIAAVEAAAVLLEAERELEKLMDLGPGELENFAALFQPPVSAVESGQR